MSKKRVKQLLKEYRARLEREAYERRLAETGGRRAKGELFNGVGLADITMQTPKQVEI